MVHPVVQSHNSSEYQRRDIDSIRMSSTQIEPKSNVSRMVFRQRRQTVPSSDETSDNVELNPFHPARRFSQTSLLSSAPDTMSSQRNMMGFQADALDRSLTSLSPLTPLQDLAHWPRIIECPACSKASITRIKRKICGTTQYVTLTI